MPRWRATSSPVFTDAAGLSDDRMQRAAREMNLSETVFVLPDDDGADAGVRIFTPLAELPFAGHPILRTAFVLGTRLDSPVIRLRTGAGVVAVELARDGDQIVFGEMEQPIPTWEPFARAAELLAALGVDERGAAGRGLLQRAGSRLRSARE